MNCPACPNENLTDYFLCPTCSIKRHFTNRNDCRCASCQPAPKGKAAIAIVTTFGLITPEVVGKLPEPVRLGLEEIFAERLAEVLEEQLHALPQAA